MIDGFDVFEAVNTHQIVGRKMNPARAENALAPSPESLPLTLIHAMREVESEALEAGQGREFFGRWFERLAGPQRRGKLG